MLIRKGFSFKLRPNGAQARKMSRFAGCTRFVYNKGLAWNEEQRKADPNFRISYKSLSALLPGWKAENSWLAETYSQCLQQAMKDLFSAFKRFFDGDAKFPKSTRSSSRRTPSAIRRTSRLMKPGGRSCSRALAGCGIAGAASSKASPGTSP